MEFAQENDGDYVVVNGAKLWYNCIGTGEPLLLISGGPGFSHLYFTPHFSTLEKKYKVIYFDAFGRGNSERANSPNEYTFERDVKDIEGLRIFLGINKLNILGHSYGATAAQAYAFQYFEHVNKLILVSAILDPEMTQAKNDNLNNELQNQYPDEWNKMKEVRKQGKKSSTREYLMIFSSVAFNPLAYFYDGSNSEKLAGDQNSFNLDVFFAIAGDDPFFEVSDQLKDVDYRKDLKTLKIPTLIIAGRFDRICLPKYILRYKDVMPQAEFVMLEKSGHFSFIEEPAIFFQIVDRFLSKDDK